MNRVIKNPFERVQKGAVVMLCIVYTMLVWSCQSKNEADQPLSDEQISFNLSENGEIDPELLIGEWDCIKFAYTADGSKISNISEISGRASLTIPNEPFIENIEDISGDWERIRNSQWSLTCLNWFPMFCSSSDKNKIEVKITCDTQVMVYAPHVEYDLSYALSKAHSFIIKGNELIFYFPRVDNEYLLSRFEVIKKNKTNLIIFKQGKP